MSPRRRTRSTACPTPKKINDSHFCWREPARRPPNVAIARGSKFYESFTWKNEEYRVGDYVLISNESPEGDDSPFVAKLEELCDTTDLRNDVNYEGRVSWYATPDELRSQKLERKLESNEVVLYAKTGRKAAARSVDLETICGSCVVKEVDERTTAIPRTDTKGRPQFFCRYVLNSRGNLKPLFASTTETPSKKPSERLKTPAKKVDDHHVFSQLDLPEAIVVLENITNSPEKIPKLKLRKKEKENYEISKATESVDDLLKRVQGVTLADRRTPRKVAAAGSSEPACTPKSSKTERADTTTRSGRKSRARLDFGTCEHTREKKEDLSDNDLIDDDDDDAEVSSESSSEDSEDEPLRPSKKSTGSRSARKTPNKNSISVRKTLLTPSMPSRRMKTHAPQTDIEKALSKLHVCAVPDNLPCREDQFAEIYDFVEGKLLDQVGSCMYISGVPGTGKTATVREVIQALQRAEDGGDVPKFKFIEINGMKLSEPNQAYVQILRQLNGRKATAESAADILTDIFKSKRKSSDVMTVLLVDELDLLWTRKQQVLYNIFDWPTHPNSRLVVVAIANTMDLPERMVMNKVASRMGLSRMTFQPYTFQELQEIVKARLRGLELMDPDAVQFISRKVAALSGDARRALDVCRRAVELSETCNDLQASPSKKAKKYSVTMVHVNLAVKEMFTSNKIVSMQALSFHEKLALRAIVAEFRRTGVEECVFHNVNNQYKTLARLENAAPLNTSLLSRILARMASSRLLILSDPRNDFQQKICLNATADDVNFALREQNECDD